MGKKWKKSLKLLSASVLLMMVLVFMPSTVTKAASVKSQAMAAYKSYLSQAVGEYGGKYDKFAVAYITKDSVPELVFNTPIYTYIYTYKNGAMKLLYKESSYNVFKYYKKKGVITRFYAHRGFQTKDYYRLSNGEFKEFLNKETYSSGGSTYYKYVKKSGTYGSWYDTKKISKSTFNTRLKKYVGSRKASSFKYYKNTAKNRNKYLK